MASAQQQGSFYLADLKPLLSGNMIWNSLSRGFDFYLAGDASRVSTADNKTLRGERFGPYTLWARPKGSSGAYTCKVTMITAVSYIDSHGHPSNLTNASRISERIIRFEIQPLEPGKYFVPAP
jgi:hypothetical protein